MFQLTPTSFFTVTAATQAGGPVCFPSSRSPPMSLPPMWRNNSTVTKDIIPVHSRSVSAGMFRQHMCHTPVQSEDIWTLRGISSVSQIRQQSYILKWRKSKHVAKPEGQAVHTHSGMHWSMHALSCCHVLKCYASMEVDLVDPVSPVKTLLHARASIAHLKLASNKKDTVSSFTSDWNEVTL